MLILSTKLQNFQALLIKKLYYIEEHKLNNDRETHILNIIYALPQFLKIARNISIFSNFIVLCKKNKVKFFYFYFNRTTKQIKFKESLHTIKQYVII